MRARHRSPEEEQFLETLTTLVAKEVDPIAASVDSGQCGLGDLSVRLAELDLFGVGVAPRLGGSGAGMATMLESIVEVASASAATALLLVGSHAGAAAIAPATIPAGGWRPNDSVSTVDAGAAIQAVREKDSVALAGVAPRVVHANLASRFVVVADGEDGPSTYLLQAGARGLEIGAPLETTGLRGSAAATVRLEGAPVTDRLGGESEVAALRRWSWLGLAAVAIGLGRRARNETRRYMAERRQCGRLLHDFGVLADMVDQIEEQLWAAEAALDAAAAPDLSGSEAMIAARRAVQGACRMAVRIGLDAIQLHGGYGYITDYTVERLLRDAVSLRALSAGTSG